MKKVIVILFFILPMLLTGCCNELAQIDEVSQNMTEAEEESTINESVSADNDTPTAVLMLYFPDGNIEKIEFSYTEKAVYGQENNYSCQYMDYRRNHFPVCYVAGGTVYYNITSHEDFDVFSGTFSIRDR